MSYSLSRGRTRLWLREISTGLCKSGRNLVGWFFLNPPLLSFSRYIPFRRSRGVQNSRGFRSVDSVPRSPWWAAQLRYKIQGDSIPLIPFPVLPELLRLSRYKSVGADISRRFGRIQASLEKKYFWNFLLRVSSLSRGAKFSNFRSWNFIFTSVVPVSRWDSDENRKVLLAQILLLHNFLQVSALSRGRMTEIGICLLLPCSRYENRRILQVSALSRGRMTEIGICSLLPCSRYENRRKYFYKCPPFLEVGFGRIWVLGRFDLLKQPGLANNIDFGYFSGKWKFNFFDFKLI